MTKHNELAMIAGFCNISAFSLLVYRVHITKFTDHLTYIWIFLVLAAQLMLFIYGQINHIFGIYVPALIMFSGLLYVFYIKTVYTENYLIEKELKEKDILKD
jgi:hypothetical protein